MSTDAVESFPGNVFNVLQVKTAYVNFVNHCYVDTEVEMKEIYTSNHIWKLFDNFLVDMSRVSLPERSHTRCTYLTERTNYSIRIKRWERNELNRDKLCVITLMLIITGVQHHHRS